MELRGTLFGRSRKFNHLVAKKLRNGHLKVKGIIQISLSINITTNMALQSNKKCYVQLEQFVIR